MTRKLFWVDPYLSAIETRIAGVEGNEVTVEETIFYALSGGQESDRGTIGGRRVTAASNRGREIVYTLEDGHGLAPGERVAMTIDWPRRHRLMRLHFAAEIVLELAYRRWPEIAKIGAHIAEDKARIDFAWADNIAPHLPELCKQAQRIVRADEAIASAFSDEAAERRYWKISEFAAVPCGGTHLKRTGEIGAIALKRVNIGKGKERIEVQASDAPA